MASDRNYSVRQIEARAREMAKATTAPVATRKDADVAAMETKVSEAIGCPASIDSNESGGWSLSLKTFSLDEFDGVLDRLIRKPSE